MQMKTKKNIHFTFLAAAVLAVFMISACKTEEEEKEATITGVTLTSSATTINATGTATLTATPAFSDGTKSGSVTYVWTLTGGSDYATLSATTGSEVTLTGKNTTTSDQTVKVKVSATYNGKTVESEITITVNSSDNVVPEKITLNETTLTLTITKDDASPTGTLTETLTPENVSDTNKTITWTSSNEKVATVSAGTVTAVAAGTATITAATENGLTAKCTVTVQDATKNSIKASDTPTGWASYVGTTDLAGTTTTPPDSTKGTIGGYGAASSKIYTVSTRSAFLTALKGTDKKIIYVDGMIDMTDGMLPESAGSSSTALDSWIKTKASALTDSKYGTVASNVTSLATWKTWYAAGNTNTADESGVYKTARASLSNSYGSQIKITVTSNTTIIGLTNESGFKGGCIKISGVSNVVLRNLIIQDSFDPFPQIEKGDGFNANWDCIEISSKSKYIWIDHCTIQDTIATTDNDFDHISLSDGTSLKYQVFDGLCDIKQASDFITVSYCKFANHDKTSLIGHSKDYTDDKNHQTITLHHNYYYNCKQRLPMVRFATIHIYNNFYSCPGGRGNDYCIGLRENNKVYAENNYFDSNVTAISNSQGDYYFTGNYGTSDSGTAAWTPSSYYTYTADSASNVPSLVKANAGAGVWAVVQ